MNTVRIIPNVGSYSTSNGVKVGFEGSWLNCEPNPVESVKALCVRKRLQNDYHYEGSRVM